MNVLVTGGAGYLGSLVVPKLVARGHRVRVLDIGYFGLGHLKYPAHRVELVRDDLRRVLHDPLFTNTLLDEMDCVIHLAAISNDPSAELDPELTDQVNYHAAVALAEAAKKRGIRFVFSSSCSVYGQADGELDEDGPTDPLSTYAVSKLHAEEALEAISTSRWRPILLRNGTLFGYSPRIRFDLVVNTFSLYSTVHNEVKVFGNGLQWRPFLHVNDCARAFVHFAELNDAPHQRYNVAYENYRVIDLVEIFREINPRLKATFLDTVDLDVRDYRVTTRRMAEAGFAPCTGVRSGAEQLVEAIVTGLIPDPESVFYRNAKWLKELTQLGSPNHTNITSVLEVVAQLRPLAKT